VLGSCAIHLRTERHLATLKCRTHAASYPATTLCTQLRSKKCTPSHYCHLWNHRPLRLAALSQQSGLCLEKIYLRPMPLAIRPLASRPPPCFTHESTVAHSCRLLCGKGSLSLALRTL
jgi:hypothetical protein